MSSPACAGSIDEIQKLHIRSVPLGEQPRRIAHQGASRTFAVTISPAGFWVGGEDMEGSCVRLLDDATFETADRYQLEPYEQACAAASMSFAEDTASYYAIGTAFAIPEETEPTKVSPSQPMYAPFLSTKAPDVDCINVGRAGATSG